MLWLKNLTQQTLPPTVLGRSTETKGKPNTVKKVFLLFGYLLLFYSKVLLIDHYLLDYSSIANF